MSNEAFLSAMQRLMAVADPEDVRIVVENANDAVLAEREACAKAAESAAKNMLDAREHGYDLADFNALRRKIADTIRARK